MLVSERALLQVVVHGLPYSMEWQDLKDLVKPYSSSSTVRVDIAKGYDGRSRGYGTVLFDTADDANSCIKVCCCPCSVQARRSLNSCMGKSQPVLCAGAEWHAARQQGAAGEAGQVCLTFIWPTLGQSPKNQPACPCPVLCPCQTLSMPALRGLASYWHPCLLPPLAECFGLWPSLPCSPPAAAAAQFCSC